jgi:hypothetical protein
LLDYLEELKERIAEDAAEVKQLPKDDSSNK